MGMDIRKNSITINKMNLLSSLMMFNTLTINPKGFANHSR